jgi:3-hydroxyisobutyrate dehydrogenase-like beta-hydroxyacid dehydrogenase
MSQGIVVIGLGEVGGPIYEILKKAFPEVYGYDSNLEICIDKLESIPRNVEVVHIAYPFRKLDEFVKSVVDYADDLEAKMVIIHSTVAPGTTRLIQSRTSAQIAYSPVRGRHPNLKEHLKFWTKWVSAVDGKALEFAKDHLEHAGFRVRVAPDPESLELAKLWETVYRAAMIACWQEVHRIARMFKADIGVVAEFISEVHEVLRDRPVYYPDFIGGHCLIPNTRILHEITGSNLLEFILQSNEKRAEEMRDESIAKEVEKVKRIWLNHAPKEYYRI